jgi:hypothetical protein
MRSNRILEPFFSGCRSIVQSPTLKDRFRIKARVIRPPQTPAVFILFDWQLKSIFSQERLGRSALLESAALMARFLVRRIGTFKESRYFLMWANTCCERCIEQQCYQFRFPGRKHGVCDFPTSSLGKRAFSRRLNIKRI